MQQDSDAPVAPGVARRVTGGLPPGGPERTGLGLPSGLSEDD